MYIKLGNNHANTGLKIGAKVRWNIDHTDFQKQNKPKISQTAFKIWCPRHKQFNIVSINIHDHEMKHWLKNKSPLHISIHFFLSLLYMLVVFTKQMQEVQFQTYMVVDDPEDKTLSRTVAWSSLVLKYDTRYLTLCQQIYRFSVIP